METVDEAWETKPVFKVASPCERSAPAFVKSPFTVEEADAMIPATNVPSPSV